MQARAFYQTIAVAHGFWFTLVATTPCRGDTTLQRRGIIKGICALGVGIPQIVRAQAGPDSAPPAIGDRLVHAFGDAAGTPIDPASLEIGKKQVFAFPQDPASGTVRNGSRLNQLIVTRVPVESMAEATLARSAEGIVAYSGVCSHTGCDVTDWNTEFARFQCPCHESQYDPGDAARVVGGPAPWPLAALPLKLVEGEIIVAGAFEGRVGFMQPGLDPFGLGGI
jgi:Rieske Fe-S protein